jgi:hypothetical protein
MSCRSRWGHSFMRHDNDDACLMARICWAGRGGQMCALMLFCWGRGDHVMTTLCHADLTDSHHLSGQHYVACMVGSCKLMQFAGQCD